MKCPYCGFEMEDGYLQTGQFLIWTPEPHKLSLNIRKDGKDIELIRKPLTVQPPYIKASCCRNCQYINVPYGELWK